MNWQGLQRIRDSFGFQISDNDGDPLPAKKLSGSSRDKYRKLPPVPLADIDDTGPYCKAVTSRFVQPSRLRSCPVSSLSSPPVIHLRYQDSPDWATPRGVAQKRRAIEAKGMPDLKGRRFLTLTLDPELFDYCEATGYLAGKDHMRRFLEAGRKLGLWNRGAWWAWKLEFQKNGWAHWHILIDRTSKFSHDEMQKVHEIWGLGRTNCRRISKSKFGYQFKYAFKGVFQDDDIDSGLCLPDWFLDFYKEAPDGSKALTFGRARFWQTSKGFYEEMEKLRLKAIEAASCIRPRSAREVIQERMSSALLIARDAFGSYVKSVRVRLAVDFEGFAKIHIWDAENGAAVTLSSRSFFCDLATVKNKIIEKYEIWKLQQLINQNRMTHKKAQWFRHNHRDLATC